MIIIDTLQQFGIDYHFQNEIQDFLSKQSLSLGDDGVLLSFDSDINLVNVSLSFRLLRQNGYHASTNMFNIFLDKDGKFRQQLINDLTGMIGLYQASQHLVEGENILDQANAFTRKNLHNALPQLHQSQASLIKDTIEHPYHLTLGRFNIKNCIKSYETEHGTRGLLQECAKMDFNIVQSQHIRELSEVRLWWRELGLTRVLDFARDQPVKWYMWSMATLAHPTLSEQRIDLTKFISFIYLMDDIFDVYGTLDELLLFTDAVNKWEVDTNKQLPNSMKIFLKALFDITEEISYKILKKHKWNPFYSFRKAWTRLCNAFLVEAKWFASGHLPSSEAYLKNGVISSGVHVLLVHTFFLLGQGLNKETVDLVDNLPGLVSYPATILRLWDDLGSAQDENQQGHDGSYTELYMKEHRSATTESAREHVLNMIVNTRKKLNEEYLRPSSFSPSFKKASLNIARMIHLMYNYDKNQRLPALEKHTKSLLYESIPLR
ncbi:hypothetical protein IFM89_025691 [Coptis chinensis]|uniref:Linalool synthase n=1 Tax=Coptis chinensis TaxID=261450 RepID=A0A835GY00_9MAGN|nr:hypothetical protein IFM89_025691 [Coptis chinensis]